MKVQRIYTVKVKRTVKLYLATEYFVDFLSLTITKNLNLNLPIIIHKTTYNYIPKPNLNVFDKPLNVTRQSVVSL